MNIELESMPNKENEWNEEGQRSVMRIELHNKAQQGMETRDFQRMVTLSKRKQIKPESKLETEAITYNAHGLGHRDSCNFIRRINGCPPPNEKPNPCCVCIGGIFLTIAVILLLLGITQRRMEERHNENRQELLNDMTDESCYLQNVTQQWDCTYSCNCREVSCRRRRLRGAKGAKGHGGGHGGSSRCTRTVCDQCQGVQFDYSGFATDKCGTDQLLYFSDSCIDINVEMPQRLLQETFTCFTYCSSQIAAFEPINLPNKESGAVTMIVVGSIFAVSGFFCFCCALYCVE